MSSVSLVVDHPERLPENPRNMLVAAIPAPLFPEVEQGPRLIEFNLLTDIDFQYSPIHDTPIRHIERSFDWNEDRLSPSTYFDYSRRKEIRDELAEGRLPVADNGFSFVEDVRPEGHEDEKIPPVEYTRYLMKRQVPIAAQGNRLRDHDIDHVTSYQDALAVKTFADLVAEAASKADEVGTEEAYNMFAGAFDGFGDSVRNIEQGGHIFDIYGVKISLRKLINLANPDEQVEQIRDIIFHDLWTKLGMPGLEDIAERLRKDSNREYERVVPRNTLGNTALQFHDVSRLPSFLRRRNQLTNETLRIMLGKK